MHSDQDHSHTERRTRWPSGVQALLRGCSGRLALTVRVSRVSSECSGHLAVYGASVPLTGPSGAHVSRVSRVHQSAQDTCLRPSLEECSKRVAFWPPERLKGGSKRVALSALWVASPRVALSLTQSRPSESP